MAIVWDTIYWAICWAIGWDTIYCAIYLAIYWAIHWDTIYCAIDWAIDPTGPSNCALAPIDDRYTGNQGFRTIEKGGRGTTERSGVI